MARVLVERETIYTPEVDMLMKGAFLGRSACLYGRARQRHARRSLRHDGQGLRTRRALRTRRSERSFRPRSITNEVRVYGARSFPFPIRRAASARRRRASTMAAYLATMGRRVLLVDIDPQGNATTGLGFSKSSLKKSVYQVLIEGEDCKENLLPTELPTLTILPANIDLAGAGSGARRQEEPREDLKRRPRQGARGVRLYLHRLPALVGDCSRSTRSPRQTASSSPSRANITRWRG